MTLELGEYRRVGDAVIAALVNRSVRPGPAHPALFFGAKHPVAILIYRDGATTAFGPDGTPIPVEELETRYPGRRAEFERQAVEKTG